MRKVSDFRVDELFGTWSHALKTRQEGPTIITAPNGAGKTHVLVLMSAALRLDAETLIDVPFGKLQLRFSDGIGIEVTRRVAEDVETTVIFQAVRGDKPWGRALPIRESEVGNSEEDLPAYIKRLRDGRWYDQRAQRFYTPAFLERRYRVKLNVPSHARFARHPEILESVADVSPVLIDTKRLDAPIAASATRDEPLRARFGDTKLSSYATSSIGQYVDQIRMQISEARRASVAATQSADLSFAVRALAVKKGSAKEEELRKRYEEIAADFAALTRNSLATGDAPLEFPEKTTPTARRILDIFLDDWQKRLDPLLPINSKITMLRSILDTKLGDSGKRTVISSTGSLRFRRGDRGFVPVSSLSSGEQHLVALFTMLLFSAEPGSIILIDEPEISMHAAWKHTFLQDVSVVAAISDFQVIIATHSTGIINGNWDIVEELGFPVAEASSQHQEEVDVSADTEEWDV